METSVESNVKDVISDLCVETFSSDTNVQILINSDKKVKKEHFQTGANEKRYPCNLLYIYTTALVEHLTKAAVLEIATAICLSIRGPLPVKSRNLPIMVTIAIRTRTLNSPLYAFQQTGFSVLPVSGHNYTYVNLHGGCNIVIRLCY
ncbi:hypothetical protein HNY73_018804 [Argiope bruennichi]|uniref:Uncharacterized protein n=1 Tax=Argiope bruennichi TaxID=94029 RepID=A0A8T0EJ60_ARGBR|nr:hypothetical protein HNY73_018804 [Argiope bruennichi]